MASVYKGTWPCLSPWSPVNNECPLRGQLTAVADGIIRLVGSLRKYRDDIELHEHTCQFISAAFGESLKLGS